MCVLAGPVIGRCFAGAGLVLAGLAALGVGRGAEEGRVLDLYGRENLVLDRDRNVRYLDSFGVFFYADLQHAVAGIDDEYQERIDISLRRLDYLQSLLA